MISTRPPYETGEIYTSGRSPGPGFELKHIMHIGDFMCQGLHKWVCPLPAAPDADDPSQ